MRAPGGAYARAAWLVIATGACGSSRDVIPESHDVSQTTPAGPSQTPGGYEYVARRPLGMVAVAESRGLPADVVKGVTERLADALDTCATRLSSEGRLAPGAVRVAAHVDGSGAPVGLAVTLTPGPGPTANALLCVVSPFKLVRFPASSADPATRGLAIEAAWGPLGAPAPSTPSEGAR